MGPQKRGARADAAFARLRKRVTQGECAAIERCGMAQTPARQLVFLSGGTNIWTMRAALPQLRRWGQPGVLSMAPRLLTNGSTVIAARPVDRNLRQPPRPQTLAPRP
ncbi:MAG: hypothetical protein ACJAVR_001069 [Paracoccaceae bacterium]